MKSRKTIALRVLSIAVCLFLCIGYAAVSDSLYLFGTVSAHPSSLPDVYITDVTPDRSAGVEVTYTNGTVMLASVDASGTATFTVNVKNISAKTYVFSRVIDGTELDIEGVYSGTAITYALSGLSHLDEIAPNGGTLSFTVTITVPRGVTADCYALNFHFIEKTGTGILPGNDEYDVTFRYNNGLSDRIVKLHENEFVPRPDAPTRTGYTFIGWYTDPECTAAWNFEIDRVSGHMTLYAGWEKNAPTQYSVIFIPNNGDQNRTVTVLAGELIPPQSAPVREGYTFIGWYTDATCTEPWNFDTDKVYAAMSLYGGWEIYVPPVPPDCNITFKPNNGEPDRTIVVLTGEFIPRPTTPTRAGYTFIGWYTDEACTNAWNFEANRVEGHTVLYGGWEVEHVIELVEYTITFEPDNGTTGSSVKVEAGSLIPRPEVPTREGYTFIGWYSDIERENGWNFDTDFPTSNMMLYAGWEKAGGVAPGHGLHGDFMGLVEALLSKKNNCLNHNNMIFDSVMESLTSKKRPAEDAPILHCGVNSVSGGTMSAIAEYANSNLTSELQFIFEVDPDPAYRQNRLRLYMYYDSDIDGAKNGDEILVYLQIISRGSDGVWFADGTYVGVATVGNYFGGGNAGKDVKTINPYTWISTVTVEE